MLVALVVLGGCVSRLRGRMRVGNGDVTVVEAAMADTAVVPLFDPAVMYVLAKEYKNCGDTMMAMGEYVEERLIELYPDRAYRGLMANVAEKAMSELQRAQRMPQFRMNTMDGVTMSTRNVSFFNEVPDSALVELMDMTEAERGVFWELNALGDGKKRWVLADLDSIAVIDSEWGLNATLMGDGVAYWTRESWVMKLVSLGVASSTIYRVMQSKARAEYVARLFYKDKTNLGRRGDAFKHIYVNLLLRRYTTAQIAWLVMDVYWESAGNNMPCDRVMDFHNNLVGRWFVYDDVMSQSDDWRVWAFALRGYVNDAKRNGRLMKWGLDTPNEVVVIDERAVEEDRYIYWNEE